MFKKFTCFNDAVEVYKNKNISPDGQLCIDDIDKNLRKVIQQDIEGEDFHIDFMVGMHQYIMNTIKLATNDKVDLLGESDDIKSYDYIFHNFNDIFDYKSIQKAQNSLYTKAYYASMLTLYLYFRPGLTINDVIIFGPKY